MWKYNMKLEDKLIAVEVKTDETRGVKERIESFSLPLFYKDDERTFDTRPSEPLGYTKTPLKAFKDEVVFLTIDNPNFYPFNCPIGSFNAGEIWHKGLSTAYLNSRVEMIQHYLNGFVYSVTVEGSNSIEGLTINNVMFKYGVPSASKVCKLLKRKLSLQEIEVEKGSCLVHTLSALV